MTIAQAKQIMQNRYSCRDYTGDPLTSIDHNALLACIDGAPAPPFGTTLRYQLIAKTPGDTDALKRLGTYGLLKGVPAYLAGIVQPAVNTMEDFGYVTEYLVLQATALGLGTCWLGGTFTRSSFDKRVNLQTSEGLAALIALGYPSGKRPLRERITRRVANADRRLPWETLFFDNDFNTPLPQQLPQAFSDALHAVRQGPSASNKQPWRIVRVGEVYHFYVHRSGSYTRMLNSAGLADLQRNDIGIAMCHFELALEEDGINGTWFHAEAYPQPPDAQTAYIVSWRENG